MNGWPALESAPSVGDRLHRLFCARWGWRAVTVDNVAFVVACLAALVSLASIALLLRALWRRRRGRIARARASWAKWGALAVGMLLVAVLALDVSTAGLRGVGESVGDALNELQLAPR